MKNNSNYVKNFKEKIKSLALNKSIFAENYDNILKAKEKYGDLDVDLAFKIGEQTSVSLGFLAFEMFKELNFNGKTEKYFKMKESFEKFRVKHNVVFRTKKGVYLKSQVVRTGSVNWKEVSDSSLDDFFEIVALNVFKKENKDFTVEEQMLKLVQGWFISDVTLYLLAFKEQVKIDKEYPTQCDCCKKSLKNKENHVVIDLGFPLVPEIILSDECLTKIKKSNKKLKEVI